MTAQVKDIYFYNGEEYSFIAGQPDPNFSPNVFDLTPAYCTTACRRGFWCTYDISDSGFYLDELYIHTDNDDYPDILNVKVSDIEYTECTAFRISDNNKFIEERVKTDKYMGHRQYKGLMYPINYTGNLVLGKNYMNQYCGFQRFYTYKTLIELEIKDGKVINFINRSVIASLVRDKIDTSGQEMSDFLDIRSMINQVKEENALENIWWLR